MAVFSLPVVLLRSAELPVAVLWNPVVLNNSAAAPRAVFSTPSPLLWFPTLKRSVPAPRAELKLPSVLLKSENHPSAELATPVVRLHKAFCPSAVFKAGYPPSGGGTTAFVWGARQPSAQTIRHIGVTFLSWSISVSISFFPLIFPAGCFHRWRVRKRQRTERGK